MKSLNDFIFEADKKGADPKVIDTCAKMTLMKVMFSGDHDDTEILGYLKEMSKGNEKSEQMQNFYKYCKEHYNFDTDKQEVKDTINSSIIAKAKELTKEYSDFMNCKKKIEANKK